MSPLGSGLAAMRGLWLHEKGPGPEAAIAVRKHCDEVRGSRNKSVCQEKQGFLKNERSELF